MNKKKIEELKEKVSSELNIDLEKYNDQETLDNLAELIAFPVYFNNWVIRPIIFSVILFITGFFILDLENIQVLIYLIFGLPLFLLCGIFLGLLFLTWKMKRDIFDVLEYTLSLFGMALDDLNQLNTNLKSTSNREKYSLLYKGIVHVVAIPAISNTITNRIPLLGKPLGFIINNILSFVASKITFSDNIDSTNFKVNNTTEGQSSFSKFSNFFDNLSDNFEKVLFYTFRIAQLPLFVLFFFFLVILTVFILIIN